jgi:hypothetical protein
VVAGVIAGDARQADRPWWLAAAGMSAGVAALLTFVLPLRRLEGGALPEVRLDAVEIRAELAAARRNLLDQVHRTWIEGFLDRSLAQVTRVELGLAEQLDAITHPWGALRQPGQPDQVLPAGTRIAAVAGRYDRQLLILGAPGAGKTTLLLEYTADLLEQANRDAASPIPVVFHLSGWPGERPPLAAWLVEELAWRYGMARRLAVELVARDRLAVLLDGLDEVPADRRAACVEAINAFRGDHAGVPLVVCARSRQYQELAAGLVLKGAVVVQPLDPAQVRGWLAAAGRPLAGLRVALRDGDHWLWELLDSPLLLSIAALTYTGQPARMIRTNGSVEDLFGAYVAAMLARPRAPLAPIQDQVVYADRDTLRWLGWLAERMGEQSVFYPDWMQPDWLPAGRQRWLATTGLGLAAMLGSGLLFGLLFGGIFGLQDGVAAGRGDAVLCSLVFGLVGGLSAGLTHRQSRIEPVEQLRWSFKQAWHSGLAAGESAGWATGLAAGLLFGVYFGWAGFTDPEPSGPLVALVGGLFLGLLFGVMFWLLGGVVGGLLGGMIGGFATRPNLQPARPGEGMRAAARTARTAALRAGLVAGLVVGLAIPLGYLLAVFVGNLPRVGPRHLLYGLNGALVIGLLIGLGAGLRHGGASYIRHRLLGALLHHDGLIPADLVSFLDYADSRILLRRAGGGYLFIHRLLQDYFDDLGSMGYQLAHVGEARGQEKSL